ncbi:hypothetical protein [Psychroserpens ponticola]|uniref:Sugar transporter n=1 Tax=Psychroserpens ponticola TaxID=2932268 RepID=A0ABY7S1J9_9FLAO|nr:hypothetical protein [Psychroserpens ponticola]WCO03207.1 hypothetical protein MUN68_006840 [Psychroserpens ponticola]
MTDYSNSKPPVWFWIIAVVALIWNGMGVLMYLTHAFMTDDMIAALPEEQQAEFLIEHPSWYTAAFALAVFCGALGCLALLIRKKWAFMLFLISFVTATIQQVYIIATVEGASPVMPLMVIIVCAFLVWFSKMSSAKGWLK